MLEISVWTNAGQQQEARRVDRPGAEDQLSGRTDGTQLAVQQKIEAGTAVASEPQLDRQRLGEDRQVLVRHHRPQVSIGRAAAYAVTDVQIHGTDALGLGDVQVVEVRHPVRPASVDEGGRRRVQLLSALDADWAARAAELILTILPVLGLLEERQYGMEVPASVAGLRPVLVIGPVASGPDHRVDAARSAEHLSERQGDGAVSDVRARLVMDGPVVGRAEILHPLRRVREAGDAVAGSARLE